VEKISDFLTGMVVLRSIRVVMTPPRVSTPRESGSDVEQQDVFDLTTKDSGLDRSSN
jgi:hypothetical protein